MQALLLEAPNKFSVSNRPEPQQGKNDVILKIHRAGICATDVTTIKGQSPVAIYPMTPGHELIATVETPSPNSTFAKGDWVTIYPTQGCGQCAACQRGEDNHCNEFKVWGVHRDGGCFAERMSVPSSQLLSVPQSLQNDWGALIEPTAVATHAIRRTNLQKGQRIAIIGAGSIGLLTAQAARAAAASFIAIVDRLPGREKVSQSLGMDAFLLSDDKLEQKLSALGEFDIVYDNVGLPITLAASVSALRTRGTLAMMAFPHRADPAVLPYPKAYRKELDIIISRNYSREDFISSIALLSEGKIAADQMITATFPLKDFAAAFSDLQNNPAKHLKVLISPTS